MTNAQLEAKFNGLTDGILILDAPSLRQPADSGRRLLELCWNVSSLPEATVLARAAAV